MQRRSLFLVLFADALALPAEARQPAGQPQRPAAGRRSETDAQRRRRLAEARRNQG